MRKTFLAGLKDSYIVRQTPQENALQMFVGRF